MKSFFALLAFSAGFVMQAEFNHFNNCKSRLAGSSPRVLSIELKARLLLRSPELQFVESLPSGHVTSISTGIYDPDFIDEYVLPSIKIDLAEEEEVGAGSR